MHAFLLIGQSNMAGRGYLSEARELDTSHIFTLRNGRWHPMFRPINPDRHHSGVNLAESFAEQYAAKHNVDVGLICCADGGTRLEQWMPGEILFDNAVFQAKQAMRSAEIVGILWHQGESDSTPALYPTYQSRFEKMMSALREATGLQDVPLILGGLGDFLVHYGLPDYVHVNRALESIAQSNEMTGFVSAQGLTSNPDNLHFNAQSLYEFGLRYLEEFEKINKRKSTSTYAQPKEDLILTEIELL